MSGRRVVVGVIIAVGALIGSDLPAASAAELATVSGVVTAPGGGVPDGPVQVVLGKQSYDAPGSTYVADIDPATGAYEIAAPAGSYHLRFDYAGEGNVMPSVRAGGTWPWHAAGPNVVLTTSAPVVVDQQLRAGASVTGVIAGAGGAPVLDISVRGESEGLSRGRSTYDPATGVYVVDRLPHGVATLAFSASGTQWRDLTHALEAPLGAGENRSGVDVTLSPTTTITGTLRYEGSGRPRGSV